jgi:predicted porin
LIAEDVANGSGTDIFLADVGANPKEAYGVGIVQTIPGFGKVSALYVPTNANGSSAGVNSAEARVRTAGADDSFAETDGESAYEIGFVGDLGVKGLNVIAFMNKEKATAGYKAMSTSTTGDIKGQNLGLSYNMGAITVGYGYKKSERMFNAVSAASGKEITQDEFGVAYAVSPTLTLAGNYTKAEGNSTSATKADAKMKSIAVGYNLGPVALTAQAAKLDNYTGVSGVDADVLYLRASTKF